MVYVVIFYAYIFEDLDDFVWLGGLGHGGDVQDDPLRHGDAGEAEVKVQEVEEVLLQEGCPGHLYTDTGRWRRPTVLMVSASERGDCV